MAPRFVDRHPPAEDLGHAVIDGLARRPKTIPPKFFYDAEGSRLFEEICRQPEYYLPDAECQILTDFAAQIADRAGTGRLTIEPGAGGGHKVELLLEQLRPCAYVPVDISGEHLKEAAQRLSRRFPWLPIHALCDDFSRPFALPPGLPDAPRLVFFPGSSLGNFHPDEAVRFLTQMAALAGPGGALLIGIDRKKPRALFDAAYNDAAGVTAAFNRNLLHRINRELGADFNAHAFDHHAFYNETAGRVEMHLVSRREQRVRVNGHSFRFAAGETLHTECSYKYAEAEFNALAARAGFVGDRCWSDPEGLFAVHYLRATG